MINLIYSKANYPKFNINHHKFQVAAALLKVTCLILGILCFLKVGALRNAHAAIAYSSIGIGSCIFLMDLLLCYRRYKKDSIQDKQFQQQWAKTCEEGERQKEAQRDKMFQGFTQSQQALHAFRQLPT